MEERMSRVLMPEERGNAIARSLKALREHQEISTTRENLDPLDISGEVKKELYALTAYVTERLHPEVTKILGDQRDGLKMYPNWAMMPLNKTIFKCIPPQFDTANAGGFFHDVIEIESAYPSAFADALDMWWKSTQENPDSYDAKVEKRMQMLLTDTIYRGRVKSTSEEENFTRNFVLRGANTSAIVSWNIMRAIPVAFYQKYGRVITPEAFSGFAAAAEPLAIELSSMHISSFARLSEFAKAGSGVGRSLHLEFPLELFSIDQTDERYQFAFDQSAIEQYERYIEGRHYVVSEEKRLGCPARDARVQTETGKSESVVAAVYQIHRRLADHYLVPNLDTYTKGALDVATEPPQKLEGFD